MTEVTFAKSEQQPPGNELYELHNKLQGAFFDPQNPEASAAGQLEQLESVLANVHALPLDDGEHNLVDHYAAVVKYLWFGAQTCEPPEAVAYYWAGHYERDWGEFGFNKTFMDAGTFESITRKLIPLGLADLLAERSKYVQQNNESVHKAYESYLDATPAGRWLTAFTVNEPTIERPLRPIERSGAEAAIRADGFRRFGPAPEAPHRVNSVGKRHVTGQYSRIEDLTIQRPSYDRNEDLALQGLRRFTESSLNQYRNPTDNVYRQEFVPDSGVLNEYASDGTLLISHDLVEVGLNREDNLGWRLPRTFGTHELSREFYIEVFERVYAGYSSFQSLRDAALTRHKEAYMDGFVQGYNLVSGWYVMSAVRHLKEAPEGREFDEWERYGAHEGQRRPGDRVEDPGFPTKNECERAEKLWIGNIEKYNDPIPNTMRLLQQSYHRPDLPLQPEDESKADLILHLKNFRGDPHVPGYTLIAADRLQQRYYLQYDPDTDPYRSNTTPIPADTLEHLIGNYDSLPVPKLAERLRQSRNPTLAQLAAAARQENTYAFRSPLEPNLSSTLLDLPSFATFVQNGAVRGTCGIHALFGKATSDAGILDKERTFVTAGYTLQSGAGAINGVSHAQLAILAEDHSHIESIVDWTPELGSQPPAFQPTNLRRERAYEIEPSHYRGYRGVPPPASLREQVTVSMSTLLAQLGVIYAPGITEQIPKDRIFAKVRKLGIQHPLNRTLGALLIASDQLTYANTLPTPTIHLLEDARAEVMRQKTLPQMQGALSLLNMLESNLQPIFGHLPNNSTPSEQSSATFLTVL